MKKENFLSPEINPELIDEHLSRLDERYYDQFDQQEVFQHLVGLSKTSQKNPVEIILDQNEDGEVLCTVLSFDYEYVFSIITGILAGTGFSIKSGSVFTYSPAIPSAPVKSPHRPKKFLLSGEADLKRRRIVDQFSGKLSGNRNFKKWLAEFESKLKENFLLLESGNEKSTLSVRNKVNEMVARALTKMEIKATSMLFPVELDISNDTPKFTQLSVISQDTPVFLYALSNALAFQKIRIEQVSIKTDVNKVEDELLVTDRRGQKIDDAEKLNEIKLIVLLTKQFTYFLNNAPNPYAALSRFEQLIGTILKTPSRGQWIDVLANPTAMQDLARVLGTSDFIWEDFIRTQYESLLPMLRPRVGEKITLDKDQDLLTRLNAELDLAESYEEKCETLNRFKDHEIFLIDLEHIVNQDGNIRKFSEKLTSLAEIVFKEAAKIVYAKMVERYGQPRTAAGILAEYAILGLGKFGGLALGYASDIELIFVYSDSGYTDGPSQISNGAYFHLLAQKITRFIHSKREGIFDVDMRLRPYGSSSKLATSLETFCKYYGPGGPAYSFERLALVRLRAVAGSKEFGHRIENIRDEFIYSTQSINVKDLQVLRLRQFKEKIKYGEINAKFSPGALVDLEYDVQILQVIEGAENLSLRTPSLHKALEELAHAGIMSQSESQRLTSAYVFLRKLINGLRMLRGTAKDLFLPAYYSDEYGHLARRMGYKRIKEFTPSQQLNIEFETQTALVRAFVERHFGREYLPNPEAGTIADIVISETMSEALRQKILSELGFVKLDLAVRNLQSLAKLSGPDRFTTLAILAKDVLKASAEPDMALNNWERFASSLENPKQHFDLLFSQPIRLEILLIIFANSQFLAETLIKNPQFFAWVTKPENLQKICSKEKLLNEIQAESKDLIDHECWHDCIRLFRRREFLRIATRDIWLKADFKDTVTDISNVADAIVQASLNRNWKTFLAQVENLNAIDNPTKHMSILAFGKLGGRELNYSSDIDLIGICDDCSYSVLMKNGKTYSSKEIYRIILDGLRKDLTHHTSEGYAYRVDFRLRPYGSAGELVPSIKNLFNYYQETASLWEIQASLKLRTIAGPDHIGKYFIGMLQQIYFKNFTKDDIINCIVEMRSASIKIHKTNENGTIDVKNGYGGIRDIEFLTQGLQLINKNQNVSSGNTLMALKKLEKVGIIEKPEYLQLTKDYIFLRTVEHSIQLYDDRQNHTIPNDEQELMALSRRVLGDQYKQFSEMVEATMERVRVAFQKFSDT